MSPTRFGEIACVEFPEFLFFFFFFKKKKMPVLGV